MSDSSTTQVGVRNYLPTTLGEFEKIMSPDSTKHYSVLSLFYFVKQSEIEKISKRYEKYFKLLKWIGAIGFVTTSASFYFVWKGSTDSSFSRNYPMVIVANSLVYVFIYYINLTIKRIEAREEFLTNEIAKFLYTMVIINYKKENSSINQNELDKIIIETIVNIDRNKVIKRNMTTENILKFNVENPELFQKLVNFLSIKNNEN